MKLKEGFITHETDGEQIMVSTEEGGFSGIVRNNKAAAFVIDLLSTESTKDQLVYAMLEKYEVSKEVVENDIEEILDTLRSIGALDE